MRAPRILVCIFVLLVATAASAALPMRTWVAGDGDDANPCSYTAPCKTFAGAISKTEVGGEISVKSPGSFGIVNISKSITIDGGTNYAAVTVNGANGVTVAFSADDGYGNTVVLRNLAFQGMNIGGIGVAVTGKEGGPAPEVHIENVTFTGMAAAVVLSAPAQGTSLKMDNVLATKLSTWGMVVTGPDGAPVRLDMNNVRISQSKYSGLRLDQNVQGTVSNSSFQYNKENGIIIGGKSVYLSLVRTVLSNNGASGLLQNVPGIITTIDGCSIMNNVFGISDVGGTVYGYGNNAIGFNSMDVTPNPVMTLPHP